MFQLAEVFQIFSQARVPQLPHRVVCVTVPIRDFKGVFRTFHRRKQVRSWGPHSGSELLPESSPSTGELMWTLMGRRWWMMRMGTRGGSRVLVGGTYLAVVVLCGGMLQGDVVTSL